jgi:acyl-CoA synthetase (AMP-forming)/AMP-acid ligase II
LAAKASAAEPTTVIGEDAPRAIIYTTSKRDRPLGCVSSHRQFLHSLIVYATQVPFAPDDVCLLVLPLTAGIGYYLLAAYAYAAAHTVLLAERDPAAILAAVEQHRPTRLYVTPDLLRALLASPDFDGRDLSSLRLIGCGSAPTPRAVALEAAERLGGHRLYCNFGGGEMGGFVAYLSPGDHQPDEPSGATLDQARAQWAVVGREAPFVQLRVADSGGRELPRGVVGELLVRSDTVMTGYWQAPADTQRVLHAGWLRTGNLAVMDAAGYVALVDHKLLLSFPCGVDADPRAVEATLEEHPAIEAAAAISVPDAECGEGVRALVLLRDDGGATATELEDYCRRSLGEPVGLSTRRFSPAVPRSAVAGLLQRELREEWWPAESLVRGLGAG